MGFVPDHVVQYYTFYKNICPIYTTYVSLLVLGTFLWAPIADDRYHFGSGCEAGFSMFLIVCSGVLNDDLSSFKRAYRAWSLHSRFLTYKNRIMLDLTQRLKELSIKTQF